MRGFLLTAASK